MFLLVPAHPGGPGQRALKTVVVVVVVCVYVCVLLLLLFTMALSL